MVSAMRSGRLAEIVSYICGASLLRFSVEMFPASLRSRQKTQVLQQNVKIYSLVFSILACAWQLQKKSYGRLFADYQAIIGRLPII